MLWESIEGKRSEDLVTEVLAFILDSPNFRPIQKLIYQWILADDLAQSTADRSLEISTQETYPGQGRFDLTFRGDDLRIVVESKFDADFSQDDQLHRYVKILKTCTEQRRILVLLCPERTRLYYEAQALKQFQDELGMVESLATLEAELVSRFGITFKVLTWDRLLTLLECDSVLVSELIEFVRNRVLTPVEFSAEELSMIMSDEIPKLLTSIFRAIDQVRGRLGAEFVGGRMSQSREVHGFFVDHRGYRFWFGYSLPHWLHINTPFSLQFNKAWAPANAQIPEESFASLRFIKLKDYTFPLTLTEADTDQVLSLVTQTRQKINQVIQLVVTSQPTVADPLPPVP